MSDMKDENIIILYQCSVTVDSIVKSDVLAYRQCLFSYYIEDIYFFEVNTKYISSNVMKISVNSRVRSTSEFSDIFNT